MKKPSGRYFLTAVGAALVGIVLVTIFWIGHLDLANASPAATPAATPAVCSSYGTKYFEQALYGVGYLGGSPTGTNPNGVKLTYLAGWPGPFHYTWVLKDPLLTVTRVVSIEPWTLTIPGSDSVYDWSTTSGSIPYVTHSNKIIICFGDSHQPAMSVAKTAANFPDTNGDQVADIPITGPVTVNYAIGVENTGNVTLTGVIVDDPDVTGLTCIPSLPAVLAPGATLGCTGSKAVTQGDIDAGGDVVNTVTASGSGGGQNISERATYDIPIARTPAIGVAKTAANFPDTNGDQVADSSITVPVTVNYAIGVENTGNVTLTGVTVHDLDVTGLTCIPSLPAVLAPGATLGCIASKAVTQGDIDAGGDVVNLAVASGTGDGHEVASGIHYDIPVARTPQISVTKTSSNFPDTNGDQVADSSITGPVTVNYQIDVENTGNVTLIDVWWVDPDVTGVSCTPSLPTVLAPGAIMSCTASKAVTQGDIDAGGDVVNLVVASGTGDFHRVASAIHYDIPIARTPQISITKTSTNFPDANGDGVADSPITGPVTVNYAYVVTNSGNVNLVGITATDHGSGVGNFSCPKTALVPSESMSCTASRAVSQGDINAGAPITNVVTVDGTDPDGQIVTSADFFKILVTSSPGISLTKTSTNFPDTNGDGIADSALAGPGTVNYQLVATNAGNLGLVGITVTDPEIPSPLACTWPGSTGDLAVGESVTCTGSITVTQSEFDNGIVPSFTSDPVGALVNQAQASNGTVTAHAGYVVLFERRPAVSLVKSSPSHPDSNGDGVADTLLGGPGSITYELVLTNTGNVTLGSPAIVDSSLGTLSCPSPSPLSPGDTFTCTASYPISQAQFDSGVPLLGVGANAPLVANLAIGSAQPAGATGPNDIVADADSHVVPFDRTVSLKVVKTSTSHPDADGDGVGDAAIGSPETIVYSVDAQNTGNVTLTGVAVSDPTVGSLSCTWPGSSGVLSPGATVRCTGSVVVDQGDIDLGGGVHNTATATGTGAGTTVTDSDTYYVSISRVPKVVVTTTSTSHPDTDGGGVGDRAIGSPETVVYSVDARNTGNVTLTGVAVSHPTDGSLSCTWPGSSGVLAPGATVQCTGSVAVDQSVLNTGGDTLTTASVSATGAGTTSRDTDTYKIPLLHDPRVSILKLPAEQLKLVGETATVSWVVKIVNTGNVALTSVEISDAIIHDPAASAPSPLASCNRTFADVDPGESIAYECSVQRTITRGDFANMITVTATSLNGSQTVVKDLAVVRSTDALPATGSKFSRWLAFALTLLISGAVLVGVAHLAGTVPIPDRLTLKRRR